MRQGALKLEVFEVAQPDEQAPLLDALQAEKMRETAFEQGYAAGWQDALEHMRNENDLRHIAAQEALQAIGFSYNEAHQALSASFLALTQALLDSVLPEAARLALPLCLKAELDTLIQQHTRPSVQILCSANVLGTLGTWIASCTQAEIELVAEPSFSEAQISLRIGSQERVIDLDDVLARVREAFAQHQNWQTRQEQTYGRP
ncbi:hypothetical protein [Roseinatronobacter monicus]|nr:hypothetical protein [Roseinatronobacter monicus]